MKRTFHPVFWSSIILVLAQAFALAVVSRQAPFFESKNIIVPVQPPDVVTIWPQPVTIPSGEVVTIEPYSSVGPIVLYFLGAALVVGAVLFLVPASKLTIIMRAVFSLLFAWGAFIIMVLWLPLPVTLGLAAAVAAGWFFLRKVWLHNLTMFLAMVALGSVFGNLIAPWTAMLVLAAIAIYDFLAVRFGYMVWMAERLSESDNLPAFVIPRSLYGWRLGLKETGLQKLAETESGEREYSILGGGDIGFPLLLTCSVYFAGGPWDMVIVAAFSLGGLACTYWIQSKFLKGRPMPALPPIAAFCLIGLLITAGPPVF